MADHPVHARILALLDGAGVPYREIRHVAVSGSAEAAAARGTDPADGGKALLLRVRGEPLLLALGADRSLDNRALKRRFGTTKTRFATAQELLALTGLAPGAVPPFGEPVLPFPLYVDEALARRRRIVFTAGRRDRSIELATADWLAVARPRERFAFGHDPV